MEPEDSYLQPLCDVSKVSWSATRLELESIAGRMGNVTHLDDNIDCSCCHARQWVFDGLRQHLEWLKSR